MAKKILIIEDSPTALAVLTEVFERGGFTVLTAKDGEEAIRKSKAEMPEVALVDTLLPGIDGFEVCRRLKAPGARRLPKVVVMTGSIDAVDAVRARKAGADDYCAKTGDFKALVETVKKLCEDVK